MNKIVIMAGGTGGHIFPALAIAAELKKQNTHILWFGARVGLEKNLVAPHYPICYLPIVGMRKKGFLRKLMLPFYFLRATLKALRVLHQEKPQLVLSMGGYASAPGGVAAWLLRIPLVIHEQNARAGLTNRSLARLATKILQAFPNSFSPRFSVETLGNPVRDELLDLPSPQIRYAHRSGALRILILGGSQGAQAINAAVLQALQQAPDLENYEICWQAGEKNVAALQAPVEKLAANIKLMGFMNDMAGAYAWADCVICRSGAMTVSEIAAVGLPAIFVPYGAAVDDHQYYNAKILENVGAARIIRQQELSATALLSLWQEFYKDRQKLLDMALNAKKAANPRATEEIINRLNLCSKQ